MKAPVGYQGALSLLCVGAGAARVRGLTPLLQAAANQALVPFIWETEIQFSLESRACPEGGHDDGCPGKGASALCLSSTTFLTACSGLVSESVLLILVFCSLLCVIEQILDYRGLSFSEL